MALSRHCFGSGVDSLSTERLGRGFKPNITSRRSQVLYVFLSHPESEVGGWTVGAKISTGDTTHVMRHIASSRGTRSMHANHPTKLSTVLSSIPKDSYHYEYVSLIKFESFEGLFTSFAKLLFAYSRVL